MTTTTTHLARAPRRLRTAALVAVGALAVLTACQDDGTATPATSAGAAASDTTGAAAPTTTAGVRPGTTTTTTTPIGGGDAGDDTLPSEVPWGDPDPSDEPGGAFSDGHWEVSYSTDYTIGGSSGGVAADGHLQMQGTGTLDIEASVITAGTVEMSGPGGGTVTTNGVEAVVDGDYWIKGTVDGTTATPTMHASSGFTGTITTAGTTYDSNPDFGVFTGDGLLMVIRTATPTLVTGDWVALLPRTDLDLGFQATIVGAFTATRTDECATTGTEVPLLDWGFPIGTPEAPTVVSLDVDGSIADVPDLMQVLRTAAESWNSSLQHIGAGLVFDFGPAAEGGLVLHVGIDGQTYVGTPTQGGPLEAVPDTALAQFQPGAWTKVGSTHRVSEGYVRLRQDVAATTLGEGRNWTELAFQDAGDVLSTIEHELGHALGLEHTDNPTSVMTTNGFPTAISCMDLRSILAVVAAGG